MSRKSKRARGVKLKRVKPTATILLHAPIPPEVIKNLRRFKLSKTHPTLADFLIAGRTCLWIVNQSLCDVGDHRCRDISTAIELIDRIRRDSDDGKLLPPYMTATMNGSKVEILQRIVDCFT